MARTLTGGLIRATPLLHVASVAAPSVLPPGTETWTAAGDGAATLTGDFPWVAISGGTFGWNVVSGQARLDFGVAAISHVGYLNNDWGTDDLAATLTYPAYTPGTNTLSAGPLVRMAGTAVFTGYCATVLTFGGTSTLILLRFLAGAQTQLPAGQPLAIPVTPHAGMTVGVSALGNRIRASFDGVTQIDLLDGGIPAGHFVGLQGFNNGTGGVAVDDLAIASSAVVTHRRRRLSLQPLAGVLR